MPFAVLYFRDPEHDYVKRQLAAEQERHAATQGRCDALMEALARSRSIELSLPQAPVRQLEEASGWFDRAKPKTVELVVKSDS